MATKCPKCQADNPDTKQFCGDCGTQLTPLPDVKPSFTETLEAPQEELTTGSLFAGRYQVIEELGKGGMGKVYRVLDKKLHEEVALKLIKPEIASDKRTLERFKNELKLARKVSQKNVGRMFDIGEESGAHYITMEYVPGEDLKSFIRRIGQMPEGKTISIANQICEGLSEAHSIGIVHRDLKPSNIMIDKQGNARIMDFGIARSLEAKGITGAGVMIGTPEYMSPEQVEGKEVDQRSDIYSLGVILYEMATGRVPFEGDTPFTIGMKHKGETPKNPKELNAQISDDLNSLILKCLEKEKDKRYQSAGEVRSELANIEKGIPATERIVPEKKPHTSREITVQFNLKKTVIPVLAVIVVIAAALFFLLRTGPKNYSNHVVVTEFINQTGDPNFDRVGRLAAERASRGLEELGLFGVAPLAKYDPGSDKNLEENDYRQIAKNSNAAIVVTGELYMEGTNLMITSKIYDAVKQELLPSPDALSVPVDEISEVLDTLSDLLKSAIYGTQDPRVAMWQKISPYIPRYEAILEFINGTEMFWNLQYLPAAVHFDRAVEIDSDYFLAHAFALMSYGQLRNFPELERYSKKIGKFSDLSPGEKYLVGIFSALKDGALETIYSIVKKLDALAPETTISEWVAGIAIATNRPRAAIEALERLGPASIYTACNYCYWDSLTIAYHMIGNHEQELKESHKAEKQFPENWEPLWYKVRALSALGRQEQVKKILEDNYAKPVTSLWYSAKLMYKAGEELKTHGFDDEAAEMYEQALLWLRKRSQEEALSDDMKNLLVWALFETQKLEEAESVLGGLIESSPENLDYLGVLGIIVAKRGDREKSLRISEQLKNWDNPYSFGTHTYWQAAIAAQLDEKSRAVSLLQTAIQQGYGYRLLYCRSSLEPLWDYPPFVELIKPRE